MGFSLAQFQEMLSRTERNSKRKAPAPMSKAVEMEMDLHEDIMKFCSSQWPRWKFIRARSDKKSTIGEGVHDITIFMPNGKVLCVECKSKTGKLSEDQRIWAAEMRMIGHTVHEIRSMEEFMPLIKS